jgi:hypothetical protein
MQLGRLFLLYGELEHGPVRPDVAIYCHVPSYADVSNEDLPGLGKGTLLRTTCFAAPCEQAMIFASKRIGVMLQMIHLGPLHVFFSSNLQPDGARLLLTSTLSPAWSELRRNAELHVASSGERNSCSVVLDSFREMVAHVSDVIKDLPKKGQEPRRHRECCNPRNTHNRFQRVSIHIIFKLTHTFALTCIMHQLRPIKAYLLRCCKLKLHPRLRMVSIRRAIWNRHGFCKQMRSTYIQVCSAHACT